MVVDYGFFGTTLHNNEVVPNHWSLSIDIGAFARPGATPDDPFWHADPGSADRDTARHVVLSSSFTPGRDLCRTQRDPDHTFRRAVWPADCPAGGAG